MRIFLCDDEPQILQDFARQIEDCAKNMAQTCQIQLFTDARTLLTTLQNVEQIAWQEAPCDVLLLDIDMPQMNGLEVAKQLAGLQAKPLLVFVTGHDELVYDSFQYHPFGFIRKKFFAKEVRGVLEDCARELEEGRKHFTFHAEGKELCLLRSDILYFEAEGNYVRVFAREGDYRFRSTLTALQNELESFGFIRVHKGFLVNQQAVKILSAENVELLNGMLIPLGRNYAETARKQLMRYMRS